MPEQVGYHRSTVLIVASSSTSTSVQAFSSRRICRDKEEHSSPDLQTLCSLDRAATMPEQVGDRRSTMLIVASSSTSTSVQAFSSRTDRRICRDKEEHSSGGFWIFRRSALWIEPPRCLSKLAIADRRCSRVFFFDEYECAGFVECPHVRERRQPRWSVAGAVDHWQCRVLGEKRDHATCEWSVLLRLVGCPLSVTELSGACR